MESMAILIAAVHAGATLFMAGLIWFVQVVHYPLFARVGPDAFQRYERGHQALTTRVVGPAMLVELVTALWLLFLPELAGVRALASIGLALLVVNWLSTAILQVPCHRRLEGGFDERAAARLTATNWLRTLCWSARGVIALLLLVEAARG